MTTRRGDDERDACADALLDRLIDLPPADRPSAIDEWCAGDEALHAVVTALSRHLERSPRGLDPDALSVDLRQLAVDGLWSQSALPEPRTGDVVGRWRIVGELGRGGMGTVYLVARADGEFEQRGALKMARWDRPSADTVRQLEGERQILASLEHPSIARLLDGGQADDGRPYFVMEYVSGRPVVRYVDEEHLTVDERLVLFQRIAAAIAHAHQRLVIHRDIKPSNVVVTDEGDVKVLDFGIARLLSGVEDAPGTGLQILTPDYASPEAVSGEAPTTASDVYQLGLLLYEVLTGLAAQQVPRPTAEELERVVCRQAIVPPSRRVLTDTSLVPGPRGRSRRRLARRLSGDIDAIVLKALDKSPEHRYRSVGDLVDDIERSRKGLPVKAIGDALPYRIRSFARRHRVGLAWTGATVVAAAWLAVQASEQRVREARDAERSAQVERVLTGLFVPRVASMRAPVARDYLDQARILVRRELQNQPAARARLLDQLAGAYILLGAYPTAAEILRESLVLHRSLSGADGIESAETLLLLGRTQHYLGQYADAERSLSEAVRIKRLRFGSTDDEATAGSLELADLLHSRGALGDAEHLLREALTLLEPRQSGHARATALRNLANVLRDRGALDEAERCYRNALRLLAEREPVPGLDVAMTELHFARLLVRRGSYDEADHMLDRSLARLHAIFPDGHPLTGMALRSLAYLRMAQGRLDDAGRALGESETILASRLGSGHPLVARAHAQQAALAVRYGRWERALVLSSRALDEFAARDLSSHPSALEACLAFGEAQVQLGRGSAAVGRVQSCADEAERVFVPGDDRTARLHRVLDRARADGPGRLPSS